MSCRWSGKPNIVSLLSSAAQRPGRRDGMRVKSSIERLDCRHGRTLQHLRRHRTVPKRITHSHEVQLDQIGYGWNSIFPHHAARSMELCITQHPKLGHRFHHSRTAIRTRSPTNHMPVKPPGQPRSEEICSLLYRHLKRGHTLPRTYEKLKSGIIKTLV